MHYPSVVQYNTIQIKKWTLIECISICVALVNVNTSKSTNINLAIAFFKHVTEVHHHYWCLLGFLFHVFLSRMLVAFFFPLALLGMDYYWKLGVGKKNCM